jgi:glycosyltransferase involved in cell wall biosynthesis
MQPEMSGRSYGAERPLLTIAVPTYNRAEDLEGLLEVLEPQLAEFPQVELLVSDNGSTDKTAEMLQAAGERFAASGARLEIHRQRVNLGADGNFAFCYAQARGRFFWLCGDDDRIVPGALKEVVALLQTPEGEPAELDLVYATSYSFEKDWRKERRGDPFGRQVQMIRDPRTLAKIVNVMFTFISGIIVNKERLETVPHEDPSAFLNTNLVQLSWALPLLLHHRRSAVLWTRPVAGRVGNANGYALGEVFGERLANAVNRILPNRPDLSNPILNFSLRRWFPTVLMDLRTAGNKTMHLDTVNTSLRRIYSGNPRYWIFTWPVTWLPLPLARFYVRLSTIFNKMLYVAIVPGFLRRQVD